MKYTLFRKKATVEDIKLYEGSGTHLISLEVKSNQNVFKTKPSLILPSGLKFAVRQHLKEIKNYSEKK